MKNSILLALLLLSFIYGFTQNHYKYDNIKINSPHLFYENKRQEQEIVLSLIDAYFSKNLSFQEKYSFWKRSNNQLYLEDIDLYQIEKYAQGGDYTPTILSMLYIDEKYQIRMAWLGNTSEENKILATYNFLVNKDYQFENIFDNQFDTFTKKKVKNLTFYYKNSKLFHKEDVKKALKFNKQMADFFEIPEIDFSCFIFDNYLEQKQLRGFDYDIDMRVGDEIGGVAFPAQKGIFSGNGTAYYPHEIVHLYTYQKAKNKNSFIDEGIATYFGGTGGLHFSEIMQDLYAFFSNKDFNLYESFSGGENFFINSKVSLYYSSASLLCYIILEHYGKEKLFELLDSGNDDWEEFLCKIEETFNIHPADYQSFFFRELDLYIKKNFSI